MTLLIACLLIHHMGLPGWWHVIAVAVDLFPDVFERGRRS